MRALVGNAADRKQTKTADKKVKLRERLNAADLHAVLSTPEGRRFYWWLLAQTGQHESVMRGGLDMQQFYAGRQDLGHELYARVLKQEPDLYLTMQSEAIQASKLEPDDEEPEPVAEEEEDAS